MNKQEWNEALDHIDPDLVEKYIEQKDNLREKKKANGLWLRVGALAACIIFIVSAIIVVPRLLKDGTDDLPPIDNPPIDNPPNPNPPGGSSTPGVYQTTFYFDSYQEMISAFGDAGSADTIQGLKDLLGEQYDRFVDQVNADGAFPQPMQAGNPTEYQNKDGFSNMAFFVDELYGLPWIWYWPKVSTGENFYIQITYLPDIERQKNMTASEVIKEIAPDAPNIDKLGSYNKIYNQKIKLRDREVTALICEPKTGNRDTTFFVYDDFLVAITSAPEVWTEQWFSELSFGMVN